MEKIAINFPSEVQAAIDSQKDCVNSADRALQTQPTPENMHLYQQAIEDFISLVTAQIYTLSTQSNWRDIPCRGLYDTANGVEEVLQKLHESIQNGSSDPQSLALHCSEINNLLAALLVRS